MKKFEHMSDLGIELDPMSDDVIMVPGVGGSITITLPQASEGRTFTINPPPAGHTIVVQGPAREWVSVPPYPIDIGDFGGFLSDPDAAIITNYELNFSHWE